MSGSSTIPAKLGLLGMLGMLGISTAACTLNDRKQADATTEQQPSEPELPTTEAEFLRELLRLPGDAEAIEVRYAVTGPALAGELTILVGAGGYKREQWALRTTGGDPDASPAPVLQTQGLTITNPTHTWTAASGAAGELKPNLLGELAGAWAALDEPRRARVVVAIREWHELLAKRRRSSPGGTSTILDVSCLLVRTAAQGLCMWEEADLFLRYEGAAFNIEATQIDRAPTLSAASFELPAEASAATVLEAAPVNYDAALDAAAKGDLAELFLIVSWTRTLPELTAPAASEHAHEG